MILQVELFPGQPHQNAKVFLSFISAVCEEIFANCEWFILLSVEESVQRANTFQENLEGFSVETNAWWTRTGGRKRKRVHGQLSSIWRMQTTRCARCLCLSFILTETTFDFYLFHVVSDDQTIPVIRISRHQFLEFCSVKQENNIQTISSINQVEQRMPRWAMEIISQ